MCYKCGKLNHKGHINGETKILVSNVQVSMQLKTSKIVMVNSVQIDYIATLNTKKSIT